MSITGFNLRRRQAAEKAAAEKPKKAEKAEKKEAAETPAPKTGAAKKAKK